MAKMTEFTALIKLQQITLQITLQIIHYNYMNIRLLFT